MQLGIMHHPYICGAPEEKTALELEPTSQLLSMYRLLTKEITAHGKI
jgi:hypothetical protein